MAQDSNKDSSSWEQRVWQQPDASQSQQSDNSQSQQLDDSQSQDEATSQAQPGAPAGGNTQPESGYSQPAGSYVQPTAGYAQPVGGYAQPVGGYAQPAGSYAQPTGGYGQPPAGPQPPQPRRSRGWIVAIIAIVLAFVLLVIGIVSCTSAVSSFGTANSSSSELDLGMLSDDTIGIIELDGTIEYDGSVCSPEGFKAQLDKAADSNIKALVLRVNSGGGTATAAEEMCTYLKNFREETKKPVVVSSASSNASGAYEISAQADYIYTAKSASIGAIGTALQVTDLSGLYDMLGIDIENITSSDSKDSTYGTRPLTDEEREYYQKMVDQINDTFIEEVADGRDMSKKDVKKLATGLTFTGIDAVDNGLADEIGTLDDACEKAADLAGLSSYETVELQTEGSDLSAILDILGEDDTSVDSLVDALEELEADGDTAK